jgi:hypothetical protein
LVDPCTIPLKSVTVVCSLGILAKFPAYLPFFFAPNLIHPMSDFSPRLSSIRAVFAGGGPSGHESNAKAATDELKPDAILQRVTTALDYEAKRRAGAADFDDARSLLIGIGTQALRKLSAGDGPENFSDDEIGSLEAIVQFDGSRPAFVLRGGGIDQRHPYLGDWANDIRGGMTSIRRHASSVGRLELKDGGPLDFIGTGFVVDRDSMLVVTAFHVLGQIMERIGSQASTSGDVFTLGDNVRIDFNGEADERVKHLLKVEAGTRVGTVADVAVLAIRPLKKTEDVTHADAEVPAQIDSRVQVQAGGKPLTGSLCIIGFPARFQPPKSQPTGRSVNWEWVRFHLTGAPEGVKRLAPGFPTRQPDLNSTNARGSFGHDATTAGGNSGSPVIAWKDQDQPAIGVHVAGMTFVSNEAEFLASIKTDFDHSVQTIRSWRK